MKKLVLRPRKGTPDTGPVTISVSGGLPDSDPNAAEAAQQVRKFVADGRAVRVVGGLPDVLQGESMSAEERQKFNAEQYAAVQGNKGPALGAGIPNEH